VGEICGRGGVVFDFVKDEVWEAFDILVVCRTWGASSLMIYLDRTQAEGA